MPRKSHVNVSLIDDSEVSVKPHLESGTRDGRFRVGRFALKRLFHRVNRKTIRHVWLLTPSITRDTCHVNFTLRLRHQMRMPFGIPRGLNLMGFDLDG